MDGYQESSNEGRQQETGGETCSVKADVVKKVSFAKGG